ncbi:DUF6286 domain-containing protein [Streptomyces lavendulae]|uniref:DUF6286 domain-containing protein n=1 Tax=Streptomyces lavendulae TaxID=1914 RepID=UPI0036C98ECD
MTEAARRGTTTIADKAVRRIADRAAGEVLPVPLAGRAVGTATVHGRTASVELRVALPYPAPLSDTARQVQQHVADRTRRLTGLEVALPRLAVNQLVTPKTLLAPQAASPPAEEPPAARSRGRTPRRWWSVRRLPVAVLFSLAAAACSAVAADIIRVHTPPHCAAAWRTHTVDWLSGHHPGDLAVTVAAVAAATVGAWLLALSVTPGHRRQLTLTSPDPHRTVAVDRSTVATLVRDAVSDVEGIETVRVRARRHRITARARLAFGDQDTALRQATAATDRILAGCGLRHTPRCKVTVAPRPTWRPPHADPHTHADTPTHPTTPDEGNRDN